MTTSGSQAAIFHLQGHGRRLKDSNIFQCVKRVRKCGCIVVGIVLPSFLQAEIYVYVFPYPLPVDSHHL